MPEKARDVRKALKAKGFEENSKRDHIYYFLLHDGKKTNIFTKVSHSSNDIDDKLCSLMAKQIKLSNNQFRDFIDCPLTHENYIGLLVQAKFLERPQQEQPQQKQPQQSQTQQKEKRPSR